VVSGVCLLYVSRTQVRIADSSISQEDLSKGHREKKKEEEEKIDVPGNKYMAPSSMTISLILPSSTTFNVIAPLYW